MSETYNQKLKFDKNLHKSIFGKYVSNVRLMIMLLIVIAGLGIYALFNLPKTLTPEVEIPYFIVSTLLPGGSPEDIETQVTIPLEKEIKRIKDVENFSSKSMENYSLITVEFDTGVDVQDARNDVQTAIDAASPDLPEDAVEPTLMQLDFEDTPVWVFAVHKKNSTEDPVSLMRLSRDIQDELENLSKVGRVEISGYDEREIHILISPERIADYDVSIYSVMTSVENSLRAYPSGNVVTSRGNYSLSINQPVRSLEDLRELPVKINGSTYLLKEFAEVAEKSVPGQYPSYYKYDGEEIQPVVVFSVYKTVGERIDFAQDEAEAEVQKILEPYMDSYEIITVNNYAQEINDQIFDLGENFIQTLVLVFVSMFLLYGIRQSVIASLSIPFTLLIIFGSMQIFDFSLNFLSIYSLLIGLGLFTDNAVVIIEGFTSIYSGKKFTAVEAALLTWKDYASELFSINLLTIWSFLPLIIMQGIMGEFIKPLPILVSVAMLASVFIALFFTLPSMVMFSDFKMPKRVRVFLQIIGLVVFVFLGISFTPKTPLFFPTIIVEALLFILVIKNWDIIRSKLPTKSKLIARLLDNGLINLDKLRYQYQSVIVKVMHTKTIRRKILWAIIIFTIFSYALVPMGFVKGEFFPDGDADRVYLSLELPQGTNSDITEIHAKELLEELSKYEFVEFTTLEVGQGFSNNFISTQGNSNEALFTLFLVDEKERDVSLDIVEKLRGDYSDYTNGKITVSNGDSGGPPAGADVEITIYGEDLDYLLEVGSNIEDYLGKVEGVSNIEKSIKEGRSKIVFTPNKDSLVKYELTEGDISFWLRTYAYGVKVTDVDFEEEEDTDIVIRVNEDLISPEDLGSIRIPTNGQNGQNNGLKIPLLELGTLNLEPNPNEISRTEGDRTITVNAEVAEGFNAPEINLALQKYVDTELDLPKDYYWKTGGSNEMMDTANKDILIAMIIAVVLITVTMVIQLGSFRRALLVIIVIPLAISGVFIFFALTGTPLSMPAMMGLLSLFGIVIANSLMIIEKVQKNMSVGFTFKDAIPEAATSRIEPILLTSASQIIGLIPATFADPIWRGFGGAIISGLSFSGVIMLFFIPIMYWILFPEKQDR